MPFCYNPFMGNISQKNKRENTRPLLAEKKVLMEFSQRDVYPNGSDIPPNWKDIRNAKHRSKLTCSDINKLGDIAILKEMNKNE